MLRRRVVVFFPHNLYPPQSEFHKRGLEILSRLKEIGCNINILSSCTTAQPPWNNESIRALKARFVDDIHIYEPDIPQPKHIEIFDKLLHPVARRVLQTSKEHAAVQFKLAL
jgi:hypothetical protein